MTDYYAQMAQYREERNRALAAAALYRVRLGEILEALRRLPGVEALNLNLPAREAEQEWIASGESLVGRPRG